MAASIRWRGACRSLVLASRWFTVRVHGLPHDTNEERVNAIMHKAGFVSAVVIDELPDAHGSSGQIDADPTPTLFGTSAVSPGIAAYEVTPLNQRSGDESRTHQVGVVCRMINPSLQ